MADFHIFQPDDIEIKHNLGDKFNLSFGIVKITGESVAVKKNVTIGVQKRELDILKGLQHTNIVRLLGIIESEQHTSQGLVLEYAPNGSLYDFLHKKPRTQFDYLDWCKQAVRSVVYIHSKGISHRDIKSKNYLVFGDTIKLTDFGLSNFKLDVTSTTSRNVRGTIIWMSPEVMDEAEGVDYFKAEVYSLGIVLWELYYKRKPYEHLSMARITQHVLNKGHPEMDDTCDVRLRDVMLNCWNYQPDQRPNAEQILTSLDNVPEILVRSSLKEEDQTAFQHLLANLSKDYAGNKYRWLKMLLHGIIPNGCYDDNSTGLDLFNELVDIGKISITDVTLLSDVAETTEQTSAKDRIAEYKRTVQCSETLGTRLTPYRKALFEALRNVGRDDLRNVIGFYKVTFHGFDNIWDVVFHLEQHKLLDDTQEKCKRFADLLNKKTGSILLDDIHNIRDGTPQQHLDTHSKPDQRLNVSVMPLDNKTETLVTSSSRPSARQKEKQKSGIHTTWLCIALGVVMVGVAIHYTAPTHELTTEFVRDTAAAPTREPTTEPVEDTTTAPAPEPTTESVRDTTTAPTREPTTKPVEDTTTAPAPEPTTEFVRETTTAPTREPTTEPVEDTTTAPAPEPTTEYVRETTAASTREPTTKAPTPEPTSSESITTHSKDKKKEEPKRIIKNRREKSNTDSEQATKSGSFFNDFNYEIEYANWEHFGSEKWGKCRKQHYKKRNKTVDLGSRYSKTGDDYYICVAINRGDSRPESTKGGYLNSSKIPDEWDEACLTFEYFITDGQIDVDHYKNGKPENVFTSGYTKGKWKPARVTINTVDIKISYLLIGGKVSGDDTEVVAIDDIDLTDGPCTPED
ncbi:uncharacterized protein [Antedon mediterranea]|uniref:uncharacterized protein n=1 Tax=Antedon mediterranea TaxID=105859 RepID=UPI003AF7FA3E